MPESSTWLDFNAIYGTTSSGAIRRTIRNTGRTRAVTTPVNVNNYGRLKHKVVSFKPNSTYTLTLNGKEIKVYNVHRTLNCIHLKCYLCSSMFIREEQDSSWFSNIKENEYFTKYKCFNCQYGISPLTPVHSVSIDTEVAGPWSSGELDSSVLPGRVI